MYPPNFSKKKIIFGFLMIFGNLMNGDSNDVIFGCFLELFMLLFFIWKLTV